MPDIIGIFLRMWSYNMGSKTDYYNDKLSPREIEIINAIIHEKCYSRKALSKHLFISEATVSTHLRNIYDKLYVHSMLELYIKILKKQTSQNAF